MVSESFSLEMVVVRREIRSQQVCSSHCPAVPDSRTDFVRYRLSASEYYRLSIALQQRGDLQFEIKKM